MNEYVQRICNGASSKYLSWHCIDSGLYTTGAFKAYGAKNSLYMRDTVNKLRERDEGLKRSYDLKVGDFPCRSFNLGKQSVASPHTDHKNLAQGWCSITPLGSFNPKKGGHLVLWDFNLMIEFPPGSTALIPSALIKHSNTLLQSGETRYSIVQYAAGGLFRWVERGFMTDKTKKGREGNWLEAESVELKEATQKATRERIAQTFTKLQELGG